MRWKLPEVLLEGRDFAHKRSRLLAQREPELVAMEILVEASTFSVQFPPSVASRRSPDDVSGSVPSNPTLRNHERVATVELSLGNA